MVRHSRAWALGDDAGEREMSQESKCCTCGFEWETGKNGRHSCTETLLKQINDLQDRIGNANMAIIDLRASLRTCLNSSSSVLEQYKDFKA